MEIVTEYNLKDTVFTEFKGAIKELQITNITINIEEDRIEVFYKGKTSQDIIEIKPERVLFRTKEEVAKNWLLKNNLNLGIKEN